eukprot:NODE_274_length_10990_cov_0.767606.p8 type:complete len:168 gc:universal NODE_274_length_10990_cov_0.767606:9415-9918(+)
MTFMTFGRSFCLECGTNLIWFYLPSFIYAGIFVLICMYVNMDTVARIFVIITGVCLFWPFGILLGYFRLFIERRFKITNENVCSTESGMMIQPEEPTPVKPKILMVKETKKNLEMQECSICLEMTHGNDSARTNCNHCFHFNCLNEWLLKTRACPICRKEIFALIVE